VKGGVTGAREKLNIEKKGGGGVCCTLGKGFNKGGRTETTERLARESGLHEKKGVERGNWVGGRGQIIRVSFLKTRRRGKEISFCTCTLHRKRKVRDLTVSAGRGGRQPNPTEKNPSKKMGGEVGARTIGRCKGRKNGSMQKGVVVQEKA